jgi:hypothetical protein
LRKRYAVIVGLTAIVGLTVIVIALVVGVRHDRGGTGSVEESNLSWVEDCAAVDEDTLTATFLLRGYATGSISVGAQLSVEDEVSGAQFGSKTERMVVSDRFRRRLRVEVDVDPQEIDDPDRLCTLSTVRDGWHVLGR